MLDLDQPVDYDCGFLMAARDEMVPRLNYESRVSLGEFLFGIALFSIVRPRELLYRSAWEGGTEEK